MSKEKIHVVTDVPAPSFLSKLPVKKVAVVTLVVAAAALAGSFVKDHVDVDVIDTDGPTTD